MIFGAVVLLAGSSACSFMSPAEQAMTAAQFTAMVQAHRIGGLEVTGATYSDAEPTAELRESRQLPACAAVVDHLNQHLVREFQGTGPGNESMAAELYDTADAAQAMSGLLTGCDLISNPCHYAVDEILSEQTAEVTLFRTKSSIDGVGDEVCQEVLGTQLQARIRNVLFVRSASGALDEATARSFAAAAASEYDTATR